MSGVRGAAAAERDALSRRFATDLQKFAASPPLTGALLRTRDGHRAAHATPPHPSPATSNLQDRTTYRIVFH
ncbi:unnamed protein product [Colias eurytheme]|nr:unnamed protein product [Colias eurytheme]